ncbi:MAG: DUF4367 domain-containing protein [Ardenticatenaceae bacterium]|nr:DUF4367 domain-containing protein [Ardenticatenaceae bacterium]
MKDKHLHTFRRPPTPQFTHQLYQQLTARPSPLPPPPSPLPPRPLRPAWILLTLLLMLGLTAMVPSIRARFEAIVQKIGGLSILMTDEYPNHDDATIVADDIITLDEARARVGYDFLLPTWLPDGLTLHEDEIRASNIRTSLTLHWSDENSRGRAVSLHISKALPDVNYIVGPNSVTEVMIHDIPATLIRGAWFENTQRWEEDGIRSLRWQMDGLEYMLSTTMPEWGGLSEAELIQMAESFPQE